MSIQTFLFDIQFEAKLLKAFITHQAFFAMYLPYVEPAYFRNPVYQFFSERIRVYGEQYKMPPTMDVLRNERPERFPPEVYQQALDAVLSADVADRDYTEDLFINFIHEQALKNVLMKAPQFFAEKNLDEFVAAINNAHEVGNRLNDFGEEWSAEGAMQRLLAPRTREFYVPTGLKAIDDVMDGGLDNKTIGVILAGTSVGKSFTLVNLAKNAYLCNYNVVYYTFEMASRKVLSRLDTSLLGRTRLDVVAHPDKSEWIAQEVERKAGGAKLIVKEFPSSVGTVADIEAHMSSLRNRGIIPAVVCVDYAEIIQPANEKEQYRLQLKQIYERLRGVAMKWNVPIWTAHQTNKQALDKIKLSMKDTGESFWVMKIADVVVALTKMQQEVDMLEGKRLVDVSRFEFLKCREARAGQVVEVFSVYDTMEMFGTNDRERYLERIRRIGDGQSRSG